MSGEGEFAGRASNGSQSNRWIELGSVCELKAFNFHSRLEALVIFLNDPAGFIPLNHLPSGFEIPIGTTAIGQLLFRTDRTISFD